VSFDAETLALWRSTPEIEIETARGNGAPVHRTTIWIVADGDTAYVRSVRVPQGRWYRELTANPHGAVHAGSRRVAVDAEPVADAGTIERVSELLRDKYQARWAGPTASMLREETLPTTLRLRAA
jgi:hypothetical protein